MIIVLKIFVSSVRIVIREQQRSAGGPVDIDGVIKKKKSNIERKVYNCLTCDKRLTQKTKTGKCIKCCGPDRARLIPHKTKINWLSVEELERQLKTKSYLQLGKELGVSDNAIPKHIKRSNII